MRAFFSIAMLFLAGCSKSMIHSGAWTIEDPVRYEFSSQSVPGYRLNPTLTIGSNGSMLAVQVVNESGVTAALQGQDISSKIELSDGTTLKQLDAPGTGDLTTFLQVPLAFWYFEPPGASKSVSKITLTYRGTSVEWAFSSGKRLAD